ncbi:MAG TPA: protein kinase [Kofleriaceae bacterium]|nr:protein kinase [Kofleriaceae bacterium]
MYTRDDRRSRRCCHGVQWPGWQTSTAARTWATLPPPTASTPTPPRCDTIVRAGFPIDVGQVIDKYELLERVGQGGMAVVYRGLDRSLKRHVAVKVLHRHLADFDEARDRFEREAHAVAKLRHENILEIFDYSGKAGGESYIVTEFIDGKTLKQFVTDHPPKYAEVGAMIVVQICRALGHAHGHGVLHRDVKPENVMIRSDGVVKLTDFGISQMVDAQRMTVTGQLLGSPAYMSPEHVEGRPLDFRTDVFAAGIVLYQLTVGKLPFEGKNPHEILKRIAECRFSDPRQANPRVGNELGRIILKAMARDADARYPVVGAMLADLEQYLEGSGLGTGKDELARYFASPSAYELALGARLTDHLMRRAKEALPAQRAQALELLDRILTIEPGHAGALELLESLEKKRKWRQAMLVGGAVIIAGGGAWGVRHFVMGASRGGAAVVSDGGDGDASGVTRPAVDAALVDAAVIDAATTDARVAIGPDARGMVALPDARRPERVDGGPDTDAGTMVAGGTFTLTVFPPESEVQVGGGAWRTYEHGTTELPVSATPVRLSVRKDDCCESKSITIAGGRTDDVAITIPFLPAYVTPDCDAAGELQVSIDGKSANLNRPNPIFFGEATTVQQRDIEVEFLIGGKFDRHKLTVHPKSNETVTCRP